WSYNYGIIKDGYSIRMMHIKRKLQQQLFGIVKVDCAYLNCDEFIVFFNIYMFRILLRTGIGTFSIFCWLPVGHRACLLPLLYKSRPVFPKVLISIPIWKIPPRLGKYIIVFLFSKIFLMKL